MSGVGAVARGPAARLRVYLAEMYPVPPRAVAAVLVSVSVATQLARIHGIEARPLSSTTLLGAWAVFTFLLTLRLMDELKDVEVDRALFPGRPLPSGRVFESDLVAALAISASLFLGAHAFSGLALGTAVIALGYAVLMFRWFFVPERMRRCLPLALATHTPVIPLLLLHLVAVFAATRGFAVGDLRGPAVLALVLAGWAGFFAWEIARKIRAPEEETAYVTYSRLLGTRGAVALTASAQTLSLGLGLWLSHRHGFSTAFLPPAVGGYLIALGGHARFLRRPNPTTSRLRPFAEAQVFGLLLGGGAGVRVAMRIVTDDVTPGSVSHHELGGKAVGLVRLRALGLDVPRFVVVTSRVFDDAMERSRWLDPLLAGLDAAEWEKLVEAAGRIAARIRAIGCPIELREELRATLKERGLTEARLAVRSSAVGEDSARHSFAGVMESRLNVPTEGLADALVDVWVSAFSARALAYRQRKGLPLRQVRTAAIVQEMVPAIAAGVLFTRDPGRRGHQRTSSPARCVIVASWGLGEGVVQGSVDTDTYRFNEDGVVVRGEVGVKTSRVVPSAAGGTHDEDVPESLRRRSVLTDDQAQRLADVGVAIERALGAPQDVEWAIDAEGRLLVLQSRPIVPPGPSPMPTTDDHRIWDNSNIVESYPGITLPLTFSFVRHAYARAFRRACAAFFPLANPLEARPHLFVNLLGLLEGRVYYNLLNWYEMFSYLARPERHRKTWDRMIGVRAGSSPVASGSVRPVRVRVMAGIGAVRVLLGVRQTARRFARLFEDFYRRHRVASEPTSPMGLAIRYRAIEEEAARFWHLTLFIDLCAMRYHEWVLALAARWLPGHDDLAERLLAGGEGVESVAPARSLSALVERVRGEPRWHRRFVAGDDAALWRALHREASLAPLREAIEEHVDRFGDRGIEELKLETITFREEPARLVGMIRRALEAGGASVEVRREHQKEGRRQAEDVVARRLGGLRRAALELVLGRAREAIRSRENMRFARSRLFGLVRGVFRRLGEQLAAAGVLDDRRDVLYLTTDEVLGHVEGTAVTRDLRALVALRRGEYAGHARRAPADRLETTGLPSLAPLAQTERASANGRRLEGTGCSAGAVTGVAHVVRDPASASVHRDQVLVARSTDPGWVFLMMSAAGLVAERGSPLSHTAIIGRELGIPTVVGVEGATARIPEGATLTIDGGTGVVRWR